MYPLEYDLITVELDWLIGFHHSAASPLSLDHKEFTYSLRMLNGQFPIDLKFYTLKFCGKRLELPNLQALNINQTSSFCSFLY